MKILQITYSLASGGAERFIVDLCNELCKENEVHLMSINDDTIRNFGHYRGEVSQKVTYHCLGCKKATSMDSIIKIYKAIKEISPDVVHTHTSPVTIYLPSIFYRKTKYVHTIHNVADKANSSFWLLKIINKWIFRKFAQPVTISKTCQDSYISFYKQNNSVQIYNGCPRKQTTGKLEDVKCEIAKYKQDKDVPVFVHVARYAKQKNQKMLFETFYQLRREGYKFILLIIGAYYEQSDYMYLKDSEEIKIIGEKKNVGDYLACSDFFVLSSLWEGLPISLIEAMSMGVVPICTPAGGIVDVIDSGTNGYLSPSFEQDDFYALIKGVLENPDKISKKDVINCYEENYTMSICAEKYLDLYKKL